MSQGVPEGVFEGFVREYGERAFQFAYRLTGNVEEAKDLVQDAFHRALRSWDRYDPSRPLDAWFFTILRHLFFDARKRSGRRKTVSLDEHAEGEEPGQGAAYADLLESDEQAVLEVLERRESAEMVRRTLEAMSDEHRTVLTLCDMEGMSYEEIARVMDVPEGTVRSRISRARNAFRRRLIRGLGVKR